MVGKKKLFATKEQLEELYNQHKSAYKIAEICNVNYKRDTNTSIAIIHCPLQE